MKRRVFLLFCLLGAVIFFYACKKEKKEEPKTVTIQKDSTEKALVLLPDTVYASVENLEFRIDTFDTIHSGVITDFTDCYANASGIFTFRGGPFRDAKFHGKVSGRPDTVIRDWTFYTDYDHTITKLARGAVETAGPVNRCMCSGPTVVCSVSARSRLR